MSTADAREDFFANRKVNWQKYVSRQPTEEVQIPEWGDETGPMVIWIKDGLIPSWISGIFREYDNEKHGSIFYATYIAVNSYDMFGKPFFFDEEDINGEELTVEAKLQSVRESRDKIVSYTEKDELAEIFNRIFTARKSDSQRAISAQDVKEPSSQETDG